MPDSAPPDASHTREAAFHTTRWSLVLSAQGRSERDALASLDALCRQYWRPLYAYVRHRGHPPHDAQDFTQEFFAKLLAQEGPDLAAEGFRVLRQARQAELADQVAHGVVSRS